MADADLQLARMEGEQAEVVEELVATYAALGASRVVVAVPISASAYEARLGEVADALGVTA